MYEWAAQKGNVYLCGRIGNVYFGGAQLGNVYLASPIGNVYLGEPN